ncbi:MAG: hypothetical protein NTU61_00165 [Candidatus Altiarchaeota archaeon]|nr:hypothetical protein [Candidatus Altiarchaeota archaeon]
MEKSVRTERANDMQLPEIRLTAHLSRSHLMMDSIERYSSRKAKDIVGSVL